VRIPACLRFWYVWKYGIYAGKPRIISNVLTPACLHIWRALLPTHHTHTHTHTHSIDPKAGYGKGKYGWTKWDVCVPQASILKSPFSFFGDVFVLQARHPLKSFSSDFDISIVNILGF